MLFGCSSDDFPHGKSKVNESIVLIAVNDIECVARNSCLNKDDEDKAYQKIMRVTGIEKMFVIRVKCNRYQARVRLEVVDELTRRL
jgi:hypothetical protein